MRAEFDVGVFMPAGFCAALTKCLRSSVPSNFGGWLVLLATNRAHGQADDVTLGIGQSRNSQAS
jgi:hypothetical protein